MAALLLLPLLVICGAGAKAVFELSPLGVVRAARGGCFWYTKNYFGGNVLMRTSCLPSKIEGTIDLRGCGIDMLSPGVGIMVQLCPSPSEIRSTLPGNPDPCEFHPRLVLWSTIAGIFDSFSRIEVVDLSNNNIKNIPDGLFASMYSLQTIILDGNSIESIPNDIIKGLWHMEHISLYDNKGLGCYPPHLKRIEVGTCSLEFPARNPKSSSPFIFHPRR